MKPVSTRRIRDKFNTFEPTPNFFPLEVGFSHVGASTLKFNTGTEMNIGYERERKRLQRGTREERYGVKLL